MKQLYCFLLLFLLNVHLVCAQQPDPLTQKLNAVFAHVDKSLIPNGRLAEYGVQFQPLTRFDGTLSDSTVTNSSIFRMLYASAYSSYTAGVNGPTNMTSLLDYNAMVKAYEDAHPSFIPIMVQRIDYTTLRPDALDKNLLKVQNNQLYDVPGRTDSPYLAHTLFAVAPSREYATSNTVHFEVPNELLLEYVDGQNMTGMQAKLDVGDGNGYQYLTGLGLTITYPSGGLKRIKVQSTGMTFDGRELVFESQFDLTVPDPLPATTGVSKRIARTNSLTTLADDSVLFAASLGHAAGKAYIHYATGHRANKQLIKPFIVVEGLDQHVVAPHIYPINYTINEFIIAMQSTPGFNLRDALENVGDYDIVFVDYARGTDDILLNAGLFQNVLNWVNTHKDPSSTEQNVVMGMSMGGLVARYKLAEMEKANPGSTNVKLLVLHDSPQRGANIPLGLAATIRQADNFSILGIRLRDLNVELKEAVALLDEPATRQLLKYQALGPNSSDYFLNTFVDGSYRQMVHYQAPYRIIATSQGSQCGKQLFAPSAELIRASGGVLNGVFGYIFRNLILPIPGLSGEVIINALPDGGKAARVSRLYVNTQFSILHIPIKITLTNQNFTCPTGLLPLDGVAGCTEPLPDGDPKAILASYNPFWGGIFNKKYTAQPYFSFVQPASALDLDDYTAPALSAHFINNISSYSHTSVNAFVAQEQTTIYGSTDYNVHHLTFTPRNGEFIFNEMQRLSLPSTYCSTECRSLPTIASTLLTGYSLCSGNSVTFSLPGVPDGTPITWSAKPASLFTISSGSGPTFTTAGASGQQGKGTITATVGTCQTQVSTPLAVGRDYPTGRIVYNTNSKVLQGTNFVTSNTGITLNLDQPGTFVFTSSDPSVTLNSGGNSTSFFLTTSGTDTKQTTITATATGSNSCFSGSYIFVGASYYQVAPNPSSTELTVTDAGADLTSTSVEPFTVELYDTYGNKVKTGTGERGKAVLNVRDLPNGLYNLRAGKGENAISEHIQITH